MPGFRERSSGLKLTCIALKEASLHRWRSVAVTDHELIHPKPADGEVTARAALPEQIINYP